MSAVPVVAIIRAKPGKEKILEEALRALLGPTHEEAGCERYALHRSADDSRTFVFVEKWSSRDSLAKHRDSAHMATTFSRRDELIDEIRVIPLSAIHGGDPDKGSF